MMEEFKVSVRRSIISFMKVNLKMEKKLAFLSLMSFQILNTHQLSKILLKKLIPWKFSFFHQKEFYNQKVFLLKKIG